MEHPHELAVDVILVLPAPLPECRDAFVVEERSPFSIGEKRQESRLRHVGAQLPTFKESLQVVPQNRTFTNRVNTRLGDG